MSIPVKAHIATYWGECDIPRNGHEFMTLEAVAREIAALKDGRYVGPFDPGRHVGVAYLVPRDTLCADEASRLRIVCSADMFGGAVRHPHVATKVITHPLVGSGAYAPSGWSDEFPRRVVDDVLYGYSAFTADDAREAVTRVLARGRARLKPANGIGGRGQKIIADEAEAVAALRGYDPHSLSRYGVVVEEDMADADTFSVGQVLMDDLCVTYFGTQRQTKDHRGESVYGGSELTLVKGGFDILLNLDLDRAIAAAIGQAMRYDAAAQAVFEGFVASRRNYDLVIGQDSRGNSCSGVLAQSWRAGGASPAELAALRALRSDPRLTLVRAATIEAYGDVHVPAGATIIYQGDDPRVGRLTKYSTVQTHGIMNRAA